MRPSKPLQFQPKSTHDIMDAAGRRFYPVDGATGDMRTVDGILDYAQRVIDHGIRPTSFSDISSNNRRVSVGQRSSGEAGRNGSPAGDDDAFEARPFYQQTPMRHRHSWDGSSTLGKRNHHSFAYQNAGNNSGMCQHNGASPSSPLRFHPNAAYGQGSSMDCYNNFQHQPSGRNNFVRSEMFENRANGAANEGVYSNGGSDLGLHNHHQMRSHSFHGGSGNMNNGANLNNSSNFNTAGFGTASPNTTGVSGSYDPASPPAKRVRHQGFVPEEFSSPSYALTEYVAPMRKQPVADLSEFRFRAYQSDAWTERLEELKEYRAKYGHCLVPHNYSESVALAQWVKRQRYQYKLKQEGRHSTMSDDRLEILEALGFVWDSHRAAWEERFNELVEFSEKNQHCNVPSSFPENPQLSVWVKCQRRQYKLLRNGKKSNMTEERIEKMNGLGFVWNPRKLCDGFD